MRRYIWNTKYRYTGVVNTIGTVPNAPLSSSPGSEHCRPASSKLGGHVGQ